MYCLNLLEIALMLAEHDPAYEDIATKFFEHFAYIAAAMNEAGAVGRGGRLLLRRPAARRTARAVPVQVRSVVGLIPLFAVTTLGAATLERLPEFAARMRWFLRAQAGATPRWPTCRALRRRRGAGCCRSSTEERLRRILAADARRVRVPVAARPAGALGATTASTRSSWSSAAQVARSTTSRRESTTGLFGGNSNWRGPVWFPVNYLVIEALRRYHRYLGDELHGRAARPGRASGDAGRGGRRARRAGWSRCSCDGRRRPAAGLRRHRAAPDRPRLARPAAVPRVLPRRQRRGARRLAPDRLDRAWSPT